MSAVHALGHALGLSFGMFWQILWALVLGLGLSGAVEAVVSKEEMSRLLPDDRPRSLLTAASLGAASSVPAAPSPRVAGEPGLKVPHRGRPDSHTGWIVTAVSTTHDRRLADHHPRLLVSFLWPRSASPRP